MFSLITGLLGLCITIILLPFRLIGPLIALGTAPFFLAIHFLTRHLHLVIVALLVLIILVKCSGSNKPSLPQLAPIPTSTPTAQKAGVAPPIIQPVTKKEDGDSDFATDLFALMNDQERIRYSQNFYWAMGNLPPNGVHEWSYYNIAGSIRAGEDFTNVSGVRCRRFSEVLKVHTIQQTITGSSCAEENGSWCKLRPNATPACGLGGKGGGDFFGGITASLRKLF